jgi:hypothetical protein
MKAFNYTITLFPGQDEYNNLYTAGNVIFTRQEEGRRTNVMLNVDGVPEHIDIWYGQPEDKRYTVDQIHMHLENNISELHYTLNRRRNGNKD